MKIPLSLAGLTALALAALSLLDPGAAGDYLARIAPVLGFATFMAIIVNLADAAGTFDELLHRLHARRPAGGWALIIGLSLLSTVFFSLDTTAVLVTPVALVLARHARIPALAAGLAVIWMANLGSLLLPISNLTNLLAVQTEHGPSPADFLSLSWAPALVLALLAAGGPLLISRWAGRRTPVAGSSPAEESQATAPQPGGAGGSAGWEVACHGILILVLLPVLLSPLPVWLSAGVAAACSVIITLVFRPGSLRADAVPWGSMAFILALTSWAALIHRLGALDALLSPLAHAEGATQAWLLGGVGALAANLINNIPAYLALEPAASSPEALMALLIGVNAGPVVSPWASLATLLWADQMKRRGVPIGWGLFAALGVPLCLLGVGGALGVLLAVSGIS
ncbi:arsenic transporter [Corynebacterium uropygiale]|uniref:Arsenic transporter n=1 Tax=Corynebacterium uropygiale TaxID=1775911 RepID=A0A9X1QNS3_9CORY|nr:arsenic transporter [Corynebacterium uropygiale]